MTFTVAASGHVFVLDGKPRKLPRTLTASMAGTPAICFAPDGGALGGAIRLVAGEQTRTVRVHWLTGRVSVGVP